MLLSFFIIPTMPTGVYDRSQSKRKLGEDRAPVMTEMEARKIAADEGLELIMSKGNKTGYRGVHDRQEGFLRFEPCFQYAGKSTSGGHCYSSAHEAALNYARLASTASQGQQRREAPVEEEVLRLAAAEGLELRKDEGAECGYRGVSCDKRYRQALQQGAATSGITAPHKCQLKTKEKCRTCFPFRATAFRAGKQVSLGNYCTAAEAGLAVARAAAAHALEVPSVGPPPLPPGWTRETQGNGGGRYTVYFGHIVQPAALTAKSEHGRSTTTVLSSTTSGPR